MLFLDRAKPGPQSQILIRCPKCGAVGESLWEDEQGRPYLVSLSDAFHERLTRARPSQVEIVCKNCGTAQLGLEPRPVSNDRTLWASDTHS